MFVVSLFPLMLRLLVGLILRTPTVLSTKKVLMYRTGSEATDSVVVSAATVTAGSDGRKVLPAGALVIKITANGRVGPYDAGATDGRQTLAAPGNAGPTAFILTDDLDVTDGDKPLGAFYGFTSFDASELTLYGATLTNVRAAFPTCHFL